MQKPSQSLSQKPNGPLMASAAHMAPLTEIASLAGINLSTFQPIAGATGLTPASLKESIAIAMVIPLMPLKPEHVAEVTMTGAKLIDAMREHATTKNRDLVETLVGTIVRAGNELTANNVPKQNGQGHGAHADQAIAGAAAGKVLEDAHASQ